MIIHKDLADGRWFNFTILFQLANVGTDICRAISWKKKGDTEYSKKAFARALELLTFTIMDPKNKKRLRELCKVRELLIDHFVYDNVYNSTDEEWERYFNQFSYAAAIERGR